MRQNMTADWAFGIRGAIEETVRIAFPAELRSWPLLQQFNFDAFLLDNAYLVLILRDKLSGVPSGPGVPSMFPHKDHPILPPTPNDAELWQAYLNTKFAITGDDVGVLVPIHDSGQSPPRDFDLFSVEEKQLWHAQIKMIIARQRAHLQKFAEAIPVMPANVTYQISGENTRININSTDTSTNIVNQVAPDEVFQQLRDLIQSTITIKTEKPEILASVDAMESTHGHSEFVQKYQDFISLAANHVAVFAPLLPALTRLLA